LLPGCPDRNGQRRKRNVGRPRSRTPGHRMVQNLYFRPNDGSNAAIRVPPGFRSKRVTGAVRPKDDSNGGQRMVQVTPQSASGAQRRAARNGTKCSARKAWGYPSGGERAQVGRPGRQAKRCPNTRAEGTEENTGPAVQQSVSQNRRLEVFIV
jgi:hypothetical protein